MTNEVAERLRGQGYVVSVLSSIQRQPDSPDSIDYKKLDFAEDIALQLWFEEVGFYSGFGQTSFGPKLNVSAIAFTKGGKSYPYETTIYYGVDAKPGKDWAIVAPDTAYFASFELLLSAVPAVDELYRDALRKVADRVVTQLKLALPPPVRE